MIVRRRFLVHSIVLSLSAVAVAAPVTARQDAKPAACRAPTELVRLEHPLPRVARKVASADPVLEIVAIGSSSTAGAGATSPAMTYPSRLEAELRLLLPRASIKVLNRGVGGETARDMLARFDSDVIAERPDLVLWQIGSNSVLYDHPLAPAGTLIRDGVARLRSAGADVVLINPQYAPKVLAKPDIERMVDMIESIARQAQVDLFRRFAVMRHWRLIEDIPFSTFLSPDELHMNDWSYGCLAKLLAGAIAEAAARPTLTATAKPRPPGAAPQR